jgi:uncharacterized protein
MEIERIIDQLTHYEKLPVKAIRAAGANREALAPRFIDAFEGYTQGKSQGDVTGLLFLAFHLLGEWREKPAYRPLARFLHCPSEQIEDVLGDASTETCHRVMAAVFDGNPQPLYELILDPAGDEFVRSRLCDVVAMLTLRGDMRRDEAASFLRACFAYLAPQQACFVWEGWQSAIALLGLAELKPLVEEAFDRGSIDPSWMRLEHFNEDLEFALQHPDAPYRFEDEYAPWTDTIKELSTWSCSHKQSVEEQRFPWMEPPTSTWLPQPAVNTHRNVGRNDPCPCGSGKKFKKCCLQSLAA